MALTILFYLSVLAFSQAVVLPNQDYYHPHVVRHYTIRIQNTSNNAVCTGAILNETRVITTATCFLPHGNTSRPEQLRILVGNANFGDNFTSTHNVVQIIVHENFTAFPIAINDIALLQVTPPIIPSDIIQFVKLPENDDVSNDDIYRFAILGFCTNERKFYIPNPLFSVMSFNTKDQDLRKRMDEHKFETNGYCTDCMFDPGALIIRNGKLVGLKSSNHRDNICKPFIFTRVASYLTWIK
ncbi:chymotrypsin-2-like [Pseudomyrmex gracilis]|uniref:chymotrypsin-2-like n=1 Tax=Pseudomyrmex gracilis TaxID=219809 RepID=UPI0009949766|nr:chymotrypsin-2-like [Pseudomyrmex gracilis]XP_020296283.1 chymotrypsin-2-like [Pseudomyrmex gracilis]